MNPIIISNNHLTTIACNAGNEFNRIEFLNWYHSLNPIFDNNQITDRKFTDKFFDTYKGKVKIFGLPPIEIKDEIQLESFIRTYNSNYKEFLIEILEKEFGINYWEETLKLCERKDSTLSYMTYCGMLSHSINNAEFTENNLPSIKKVLENLIDDTVKNKKKFYAELIQYLSFGITNREVFGNDWLIQNVNEIFKIENDGSSKQFNFYVDKISKQLEYLDFSPIRPCLELKKIMKGKMPLLTANESTVPFFWEIDMPRYAMNQKVVQQLLQSNCITGLEVIDKFLKSETDVLVHFVKREKNKMSLTVLHESEKLNEKLSLLVSAILDKTKLNLVIDPNDFENSLLVITLGETLKSNDKIKRSVKI